MWYNSNMKKCPRCKAEKPIDEFPVDKTTRDGRFTYCRSCAKEYRDNYRKLHPEKFKRSQVRSAKKLREKWRSGEIIVPESKWCKDCYQMRPANEFYSTKSQKDGLSVYCKIHMNERGNVSRIKSSYGLSKEQLKSLIDSQQGLCAICKEPISGKNLHIDHCHNSSKVRGVLCRGCNLGLGQFKDDPERLKNAIKYLESPGY
jgi:hypothetical protein